MLSLMSRNAEKHLAALASVPGIGRVTLRNIYYSQRKHGWKWDKFWVLDPKITTKIPISENIVKAIKNWQNENTINSNFSDLELKSIRVVVLGSPEYPPLLAQVSRPPILLFAKGATPDWTAPTIAVVGTRTMTNYGKVATRRICSQLATAGALIISGSMYGIDSEAHRAALSVKAPTVGVLGFGFDHVYPSTQKPLLEEIVSSGGTLYSEYAPSVEPRPGNFVARNSIVAGMAAATIVVEAAAKSGSHITAQFALDANRTVCAVPGPITNPYSEGTKWLVNEGAVMVSSGADVLAEIGVEGMLDLSASHEHQPQLETELERALYSELEAGSQTFSQVLTALAVPMLDLQTTITQLEIRGVLEKQGELLSICHN